MAHIMKLADVAKGDIGDPILATKGTIKSVLKPKKGTNKFGDWTLQSLTLTQDGCDLRLQIWNHGESPKEAKGRTLILETGRGNGNSPKGLKLDEDDKGNVRIKAEEDASVTLQKVTNEGSSQEPRQDVAQESESHQASPPQERQEEAPQEQEQPPQEEAPAPETDEDRKIRIAQEERKELNDAKRSALRIKNLGKIAWIAADKARTELKDEVGIEVETGATQALASTILIQLMREGNHRRLPLEFDASKK